MFNYCEIGEMLMSLHVNLHQCMPIYPFDHLHVRCLFPDKLKAILCPPGLQFASALMSRIFTFLLSKIFISFGDSSPRTELILMVDYGCHLVHICHLKHSHTVSKAIALVFLHVLLCLQKTISCCFM